jgi:hypothetical protein
LCFKTFFRIPIILSDCLNSIYSDVINIPQNISDHDAAVAYIDCPKGNSTTFKREIWQYDKIDIEKFDKNINDRYIYNIRINRIKTITQNNRI